MALRRNYSPDPNIARLQRKFDQESELMCMALGNNSNGEAEKHRLAMEEYRTHIRMLHNLLLGHSHKKEKVCVWEGTTLLWRMWINQPSTLQELHDLHGVEVMSDLSSDDEGFVQCRFPDGSEKPIHRTFLAYLFE